MACDVALGQEFETIRDKYMDKAQPGTQCTHALGKFAPTESGMVDDGTGCMMPLGMNRSSPTVVEPAKTNSERPP